MPKIKIEREHSLDRSDLEDRVEKYLVLLRDDKMKMVNFDFKWSPDRKRVELTGSGFSGETIVEDKYVSIFVDMKLMLAPFKKQVEDGLKKGLDKYLA